MYPETDPTLADLLHDEGWHFAFTFSQLMDYIRREGPKTMSAQDLINLRKAWNKGDWRRMRILVGVEAETKAIRSVEQLIGRMPSKPNTLDRLIQAASSRQEASHNA